MRDYLSHEVRNVVVLGHSGVGKTAVMESMLYFTKAIALVLRVREAH